MERSLAYKSINGMVFCMALSAILILPMLEGASAQTENGFKEIDVLNNFELNPFSYFVDAPIIAAGGRDSYNAMTIGWGGMGTLWGWNRPVVTVYVAPGRFKHRFLEKSKYFTVMQFLILK